MSKNYKLDFYIINTSDIDYKMISNLYNSSYRQQIIDDYKNDHDKLNMLLSEMIVKMIYSKMYKLNLKTININVDPFGKPSISNSYNFNYSISHTSTYLACCVSNHNIGIDIEVCQHMDESLLQLICTPKELDYILNSNYRNISSTMIWTRKEAYYKFIGTGLQDNINEFDTLNRVTKDNLCLFSFYYHNHIISICANINKIQTPIYINELEISEIIKFFINSKE
ncbi:hypothetical protein N494_03655 [Clostridium botulinum A2B7 92]|uniref:4'-phosphopantetheinyl transferase family protein n=1 Tax=Clostridium botulinum TaxID=1491 RepID=UPI0007DEF038|nr:4'-phosphopantetheinyl transferase superfamily protein [Clostridium botulinum]KEJ00115.1 hypothetical protein N494_03655 [Clostridium botulinum A2B7 92]